jgi:hypothetical protein
VSAALWWAVGGAVTSWGVLAVAAAPVLGRLCGVAEAAAEAAPEHVPERITIALACYDAALDTFGHAAFLLAHCCVLWPQTEASSRWNTS